MKSVPRHAMTASISQRALSARRSSLRFAVRAAICAVAFGCALPADAVPDSTDVLRFTRETPIRVPDIFLANGVNFDGSIAIEDFAMDVRVARGPDGGRLATPVAVGFDDILGFAATLLVPLDDKGTIGQFGINPDNATIEGLGGGLKTDGIDLFIDAGGTLPGTPLYQITVDKPFDAFDGFPNGRRDEDDTSLLLKAIAAGIVGSFPDAVVLVQAFSGSINLGAAVLPDGFFGPPELVASGQLTPDDRFVLAQAGGPVSAVPVPPAALLLVSALGGLLLTARRQSAQRVL